MSGDKYKIHVDEMAPDGSWHPITDVETKGYLLMADKDNGEGMDAFCMGLNNVQIMTMVIHFPLLRKLILRMYGTIAQADQILSGKEKFEIKALGQCTDAEAMLANIPGAEKPAQEKPAGMMEKIRNALRRKG